MEYFKIQNTYFWSEIDFDRLMYFQCSFMSIFIVQAKHNSKIVKENPIKINLLTHFSTIDVLDCLLAEEEIHVITICQRSHKIGCCKIYIICTNHSSKLILNYTLNQNNVEPAFHKKEINFQIVWGSLSIQ